MKMDVMLVRARRSVMVRRSVIKHVIRDFESNLDNSGSFKTLMQRYQQVPTTLNHPETQSLGLFRILHPDFGKENNSNAFDVSSLGNSVQVLT